MVMNDVPNCLILSFVVKVIGCYVLECPCEYRIGNVVCLVPKYRVDYYQGVVQNVEEVLPRSSNISVKVILDLVV